MIIDDNLELLKVTDLEDRKNLIELASQQDIIENNFIKKELELKELKQSSENNKKIMYELMEKYNVKSFETLKYKITRIVPSIRVILDSKRIKEELPEIYEKYSKSTEVSGSIRITKRKEKE